jgi:fluoroquinolone transport system permease protein
MKELSVFLRWDAILLYRNRLYHIAVLITVIYTGIFFLLKPLGSLTNILIVLIFNDPVVTGYIFGGILWLFDKNQHTLEAISVLPVRRHQYLLSKILVLSFLAVLISLVMTMAARGMNFNWLHLVISVFLTSFLFSSVGFTIASISRGFNEFLLYSIPVFIVSAVPFLYIFGIGDILYYLVIPTTGSIEVLRSSFIPMNLWYQAMMYIQLIFWTVTGWRLAMKITQSRRP